MAQQQYAAAKAAMHSRQPASPAARQSIAPGPAADQPAPGQAGPGGGKEPGQATDVSQQHPAKQPASYMGSGQAAGLATGAAGQGSSYYAFQQGMSEDYWGYPSTGGPAYPGVYNPYP